MSVQVAVVGAGGVGGFLAALLARAGNDVAVLARGPHLEAIRGSGLQLRSQQFGDITVKPTAADDVAALGQADLVIIGVKMYDFADAAQAARRLLKADGVAITVQNGLDAPDQLAQVVGADRVLIGTASIEATIIGPGVIGHLVRIHQMTLSEYQGPSSPRLERIVDLLKAAEINVSIAPDGRQALWDKAASLIPIATITASAASSIGPIFNLHETRQLFTRLMAEAAAVAGACGHSVSSSQAGFTTLMEQAVSVRPDFSTSMERDFQKQKRTELEWLTGSLVRLAEEHQIEVPVHRTLYALLKLKGQRARQRAEPLPASA